MNELEGRALALADLATGCILAVFGIAVVVISAGMPTFADRGANPLTAPGIFPGAIGGFLLVCGVILAGRSVRRVAHAVPGAGALAGIGPVTACFALMVVAVAFVGVVDFRIVATGFTLAFAALFIDWKTPGPARLRKLAAVAFTAALAGTAIPMLFEHVFLVRLP
ncbi:MAG TPA: hypothetical protein PKA74_08810 [Bauldia sp.]|nr:hypothetical protein [Bauldia sp.]